MGRSIDKRAELLETLMIVVQFLHLCQILQSLFLIAHTIVSEGKHVLAMDEVLRI